MNIELLEQVIYVALAGSVFTTAIVQQIKGGFNFKSSKAIILINFIASMIIGTLFALSFSNLKVIYALWVGFADCLGATGLYKALEKLGFVKSLSEIQEQKKQNAIELERTDK